MLNCERTMKKKFLCDNININKINNFLIFQFDLNCFKLTRVNFNKRAKHKFSF